jgi:hypothetical protein
MKIFGYITCSKLSILVAAGILMTVASAIITNSLIEQGNLRISSINKEKLTIERRIDSQWQFLQESKGKLDLAINVVAVGQKWGKNQVVNNYFYNWFSKISEDKNILKNQNIESYIKLVDDLKIKTIEDIDSLYLEKVTLESDISNIAQKGMFLKNLALMLQILGLILVLSRNFYN